MRSAPCYKGKGLYIKVLGWLYGVTALCHRQRYCDIAKYCIKASHL